MIRIVCQSSDPGMAINIGGPIHLDMKTFDVDLPEVEAWFAGKIGTYESRDFIGIEILPKTEDQKRGEP